MNGEQHQVAGGIDVEALKADLELLRRIPFGSRRAAERLVATDMLTELGRRVVGEGAELLAPEAVQLRLIEAVSQRMPGAGPAVLAFFGATPGTSGGSFDLRAQHAGEAMDRKKYPLAVSSSTLTRRAYFAPFIEQVALSIIELFDEQRDFGSVTPDARADTHPPIAAAAATSNIELNDLLRQLALHLQEFGLWLLHFDILAGDIKEAENDPAAYERWKSQYEVPTGATPSCLFELLKCSQLVGAISERPDGRVFLRNAGLESYVNGPFNPGNFADASVRRRVAGVDRSEQDIFIEAMAVNRDDLDDLFYRVRAWNEQLTGIANPDTDWWDMVGQDERTDLLERTTELLNAVYDRVPDEWSQPDAVLERADEIGRRLASSGRCPEDGPIPRPKRGSKALLKPKRRQRLWDALTAGRYGQAHKSVIYVRPPKFKDFTSLRDNSAE